MAPKASIRPRRDDVDLDRDRSLVERCQAGDERAFEDLYLRYRDRLYRSCLRRTGDPAEAEDLVQEAFARAWKALPGFRGERRFYPWLSVIANNLCTDHARRGRRCTPVEESSLDLLAPPLASEQESRLEAAGDGEILAAALGRLSPRHREVLELREGRNWSYQQIASHSGVEVSTIETLLFRARRSLKREFMTIAKAETGLAGALAFPLAALRSLWRRGRHLLRHGGLPAKLTAAFSQVPVAPIVGGVAVAATAAAVTVGAVAGTHPAGLAQAAARPAVAARPAASGGTTSSEAATARRASLVGSLPAGERLVPGPTGAGAEGSPSGRGALVPGTSSSLGSAVSTAKKGSGLLGGATDTLKQAAGGLGGALGGAGGGRGSGSGVSGAVSSVSSGVSSASSGVSSGLSAVSGAVSGILGGGGSLP